MCIYSSYLNFLHKPLPISHSPGFMRTKIFIVTTPQILPLKRLSDVFLYPTHQFQIPISKPLSKTSFKQSSLLYGLILHYRIICEKTSQTLLSDKHQLKIAEERKSSATGCNLAIVIWLTHILCCVPQPLFVTSAKFNSPFFFYFKISPKYSVQRIQFSLLPNLGKYLSF